MADTTKMKKTIVAASVEAVLGPGSYVVTMTKMAAATVAQCTKRAVTKRSFRRESKSLILKIAPEDLLAAASAWQTLPESSKGSR